MDGDNGNGVGTESYASSGHGTPMAWQSQMMSNSCTVPMQRDMDSFAWASVYQPQSRPPAGAISGGLFPPPAPGFHAPQAAGFEHFAVDSGAVERAVRSCLGGGNGTMTAGAFTAVASTDHVNGHDGTATAAAGECTSGGPDSKKKRSDEIPGTDQAKTSGKSADSANEAERSNDANGEQTGGAAAAGKPRGNGAKEAGESQKEGYIHVRARKGQATNSHSLAEKLRRERISERMKLLQDLVPGCSKVTGKAVMLDEIINYVQSLQRQVEFLSMKLSTVNPRLDLNIESLHAKDIVHFRAAPSTTPNGFSFSQEMMPQLSQSGMLQEGVHRMANPDVSRTVIQAQLCEKDAFRESASQIHHMLDVSFRDATQMAYPLVIGSEDLSIKPDYDGFHM